jgi:hypothetical protein
MPTSTVIPNGTIYIVVSVIFQFKVISEHISLCCTSQECMYFFRVGKPRITSSYSITNLDQGDLFLCQPSRRPGRRLPFVR